MRIIDLAVNGCWSVKLGVIEHVEGFQPELKRFRFSDSQHFGYRHVEIADTGAVKKPSWRISQLPEILGRQGRSIELGPSVSRIRVDIEWPAIVLRRVEQIIVDAVAESSQQRIVRVVVQSYGKARAETSRAGDTPSVRKTIVPLENALKRNLHLVTRYEIVCQIEC